MSLLDNPLKDWDRCKVTMKEVYQIRPPKEYLINPIAPIASLISIVGNSDSLKSMFTMVMGAATLTGKDFLPPEPGSSAIGTTFKTTKANVMWIDQDNGKIRTENRWQASAKAYNVPEDAGLEIYSFPLPTLNLSKDSHATDLMLRIADSNTKLVVIDNLVTISGGVDENSAEIMKVMMNLRYIVENAQCAVFVIHHLRKSNGIKGLAGDNMRGFSGIKGAIDSLLVVSREPGSSLITISSEKSRDAQIPSFSAKFSYTHKPGTKELDTAMFYCEGAVQKLTNADIADEVIAALTANANPMTQSSLVREVQKHCPGIGINRIRTEINNMANLGLITMRNTGGSYLYALP